MKSIKKIVVIDDQPDQLDAAVEAVKAAGYEPVAFSSVGGFNGQPDIWTAISECDAVVTDLYWDPKTCGDPVYRAGLPPMGLMVVIHAIMLGKPVVICTDLGNHAAQAAFIHDSYMMHHTLYDQKAKKDQDKLACPFGWNGQKDWAQSVRMIESGIKHHIFQEGLDWKAKNKK